MRQSKDSESCARYERHNCLSSLIFSFYSRCVWFCFSLWDIFCCVLICMYFLFLYKRCCVRVCMCVSVRVYMCVCVCLDAGSISFSKKRAGRASQKHVGGGPPRIILHMCLVSFFSSTDNKKKRISSSFECFFFASVALTPTKFLYLTSITIYKCFVDPSTVRSSRRQDFRVDYSFFSSEKRRGTDSIVRLSASHSKH